MVLFMLRIGDTSSKFQRTRLMKQCEIRDSDLWVEVLVALFMIAAIGGAGIFYIRSKAPGPDEMNKPEYSSVAYEKTFHIQPEEAKPREYKIETPTHIGKLTLGGCWTIESRTAIGGTVLERCNFPESVETFPLPPLGDIGWYSENQSLEVVREETVVE